MYILDESLFEELNNTYILYRGGYGEHNDSSSRNQKITSIWMTNSKEYAETYSKDVKIYEVRLDRIYKCKGAPLSCAVDTYINLYKPKTPNRKDSYSSLPFFHPDVIMFYPKYVDYFMGICSELTDNIYDKPKSYIDKKGNTHYEFDSRLYWRTLDKLNCIKAKELGYDAISYELDFQEISSNSNSDVIEYCILDKACIKREIK